METAQGKGEDCTRNAHTSPKTTSARLTPSATPLRVRDGTRQGQRRAGAPLPHSPAPGTKRSWRPQREYDFGGEETTASQRGEVDGREPVSKGMPCVALGNWCNRSCLSFPRHQAMLPARAF